MPLSNLRLRFHTRVPLGLLPLMCAPWLAADTELNIPGYRLIWYDEFEGDAVDPQRWEVNEGVNAAYQRASDDLWVEPHWFNEDFDPWSAFAWINNEMQYYSPNNVAVRNGVLEITAREEQTLNPVGWYDPVLHPYTSGKLNSANEFQFRFGIVKWRAQLPAGQGLWPALWMLNQPKPTWYWDDEIDVMEARGGNPNETTSARHYKVVDPVNENIRTNFYDSGSLNAGFNLQTSFNEYGLEWDTNRIRTTLNESDVFTTNQNVPQDDMFLIMNAAVGGGFGGPPDASTVFPSTFSIDWVRVWQPAQKPSDLSNGDWDDYQGAQWADWNTLDDGNISTLTSGALHGDASVRIAPRLATEPFDGPDAETPAENLLDGASEWRGYLNEFDSAGNLQGAGPRNPADISATVNGDEATLGLHAASAWPVSNAVIYRELPGSALLGRELTFSGSASITQNFPAGTIASAVIRIFDPGYNVIGNISTDLLGGGAFSVTTTIPDSDIPIVQFVIETTGPTGGAGSLMVSNLLLIEEVGTPEPPVIEPTGFSQTLVVAPDDTLHYGALAANDPSSPLTAGAEGQMHLEFLDADNNVLSSESTRLVDSTSPSTAVPFRQTVIAPADSAFARLSFFRLTLDPGTDTGGAFIVDGAFLQRDNDSDLPLFLSSPPAVLSVTAGDIATIPITVASKSDVTYSWYREGVAESTSEDYSFTATPASSGRYFVVARNEAGPVVGGWTDLTVDTPDSDADRIIDYDENVLYHTDPAKADSDSDGLDDYSELFVSLTDPLDPDSRLAVTALEHISGTTRLTFDSVIGVQYRFEASGDLQNWQSVGTPLIATEDTSSVDLTLPVRTPELRYIRIAVDE